MLIVIDGLDSSGKKTQSDLLIEKLKNKGLKTSYLDFPRYESFYGKLVGRYLKGEFGDVNNVSPYLASLLYAFDRLEVRDLLVKWLNEGRIIISNRYVSSNIAYQGAKIRDKEGFIGFKRWVEELEYKRNHLPVEDILFYLNVPIEISQKWLEKRDYREYMQEKGKDIHEKNLNYLKDVERIFIQLVKEKRNYVKIDCIENNNILSSKEINEKIWKYLESVQERC